MISSSLRDVARFFVTTAALGGRRFWLALALTLVQAFTAGVMVLALLPLARAAGVGDQASQIPAPLSWAADRVPSLEAALLLLLALAIGQAALGWAQSRVSVSVSQRVVQALRIRLFDGLCRAEWQRFVRQDGARITAVLTGQVERVGYSVYEAVSLAAGGLTVAVYVALAAMISPPLTLLVLAAGALLSAALRGRHRRAIYTGRSLVDGDQRVHREVADAVAHMKVIRAHGAESIHLDRFHRVVEEVRRTHVRLGSDPAWVRGAFDVGATAIVVAAAYIALAALRLPPAELLVMLVCFWRLSPHIGSVQVYFQTVLAGLPAHAAVEDLAGELQASPSAAAAPVRFTTAVTFEDVAFSYDGRERVLDGVNLTIGRRELVGISGDSGAGKTTLADLVLGLLHPTAGRILVDGVVLTPAHLPEWRRRIAYVPQDAPMFNETIRQNLLWAAPAATEADLWSALDAAAAGFARALPDGLDTRVGDRGGLLSGGERQRLAIARAWLRRPELLVLDEPSSALDPDTERLIRESIDRLRDRTAILLISHRPAMLVGADRSYTLRGGRLVEQPAPVHS